MASTAAERPRGIVRTREDEILFVGCVEFVAKQACSCPKLPRKDVPCIVCQARAKRSEL